MPKLQTYVIRNIPPKFRGFRSRAPLSDRLRPNARAEEIPDLIAEGLSGDLYIEAISAYSGRNGADGAPLLWRVICAQLDTP